MDPNDELSDSSYQQEHSQVTPGYTTVQRIPLGELTYHALRKVEGKNLKTKLGVSCDITFSEGNNLVVSSYSPQQSQRTELLLKDFIQKIRNKELSGSQMAGRSALVECASVKAEIAKNGYHLVHHHGKVHVYSHSLKPKDEREREFSDIKNYLLGFYYEQIPYRGKGDLTRTQRAVLENMVVGTLENFRRLIKENNSLVSIDFKQYRSRKSAERRPAENRISFIVRSKHKLDREKIFQEIQGQLKQCRSVILISDKMINLTPEEQPAQGPTFYRYKPHDQFFTRSIFDDKFKQAYLIITFRKTKKADVESLRSYIASVVKDTNLIIKGIRVFSNQMMGLRLQAIADAFDESYDTSLFPETDPYSLALFPRALPKDGGCQPEILQLCRSLKIPQRLRQNQTPASTITASKQQTETLPDKEEVVAANENADFALNDISQQQMSFLPNQVAQDMSTYQEDQDKELEKGQDAGSKVAAVAPKTVDVALSKRTTKQKHNGVDYLKVQIEISQQLKQSYDALGGEDKMVWVTGYPLHHLESFNTYLSSIEYKTLEEALNDREEEILVARVKTKLIEGETDSKQAFWSILPLYRLQSHKDF